MSFSTRALLYGTLVAGWGASVASSQSTYHYIGETYLVEDGGQILHLSIEDLYDCPEGSQMTRLANGYGTDPWDGSTDTYTNSWHEFGTDWVSPDGGAQFVQSAQTFWEYTAEYSSDGVGGTFDGDGDVFCGDLMGGCDKIAVECSPCQCPYGTAALGEQCTSSKMDKTFANNYACQECTGTYWLDERISTNGGPQYSCVPWTTCTAGQYETRGPTNTADRICADNACSCFNGTAATGAACTSNNANICAACTGDFYLSGSSCVAWAPECSVGQHQTQSPSNTEDRVCSDNMCSCSNGVASTGDACTSDDANICTACTGDFYLNSSSCVAWAPACSVGQHQTQSPSTTEDRVCSDNECSCSNGVAATGAECTSNNANICSACTGDFYLSGSSCAAWAPACSVGQHQTQSPSNTEDRVCSDNDCSCSGGDVATGDACTSNNANMCTACHPRGDVYLSGFTCVAWAPACSVGQHQTQSPSTTEDRVCSDNVCSCSDGVAATGAECTSNNANICTACTGDFYLNGFSCAAWAPACSVGQHQTQSPSNTEDRVCSDNVCSCTDGVAATGNSCTSNNANICAACTGDFWLNPVDLNCAAWSPPCPDDDTEHQAPSNTQDRVCEAIPCTRKGYAGTAGFCTCAHGYEGTVTYHLGEPTGCIGDPCDASWGPMHGMAGSCTSDLKSGYSCLPVCDTTFTLTGLTTCEQGILRPAICACTGEFYLNVDRCEAWAAPCTMDQTQTQAPTNSQDRICEDSCSNQPSPYMIENNKACGSWAYMKNACNKNQNWIANNYCQQSCHDLGLGYINAWGHDNCPDINGCTNKPSRHMVRKNKSCDSWDKLSFMCNQRLHWKSKKFCQKSCYDLGAGYDGDVC